MSDAGGGDYVEGALRVEVATLMFADVVESVRLVEYDEVANVHRLRSLLLSLIETVVPRFGGLVLERRGDGLLVRFEHARAAAACAIRMHEATADEFMRGNNRERIQLRIGINSDQVLSDSEAIYGKAINLAARLASAAAPGQTIVPEGLRDQLTSGVDGAVVDLGDCYVKHMQRPLRLFAVEGLTPSRMPGPMPDETELRPKVAVLPMQSTSADTESATVADTLSDELNHALARVPALFVLSRLSMQSLRARELTPEQVRTAVGADFVVSGRVTLVGASFRATVELCDARTNEVVWSDRVVDVINAMLLGDCDAIASTCAAIGRAVLGAELRRTQSQPLPTLASQSLLSGAISLMHRSSAASHEQSSKLLATLIDRHARHAAPYMWYAKQQLLRSWRGWATDAKADAKMAKSLAEKALQANPDSDMAHAIRGMISSHIDRDFDAAGRCYNAALALNPNEPLTWIFMSTRHSFLGEGTAAMASAARAMALSPLDPLAYYYRSLAASAALTAGDLDQAITLALLSHRENKYHLSNHRVLAIAYGLRSEIDIARPFVAELLALDPQFSVTRFAARSTGANRDLVERFSESLRRVGVPV